MKPTDLESTDNADFVMIVNADFDLIVNADLELHVYPPLELALEERSTSARRSSGWETRSGHII
jgi:hypothetical protein